MDIWLTGIPWEDVSYYSEVDNQPTNKSFLPTLFDFEKILYMEDYPDMWNVSKCFLEASYWFVKSALCFASVGCVWWSQARPGSVAPWYPVSVAVRGTAWRQPRLLTVLVAANCWLQWLSSAHLAAISSPNIKLAGLNLQWPKHLLTQTAAFLIDLIAENTGISTIGGWWWVRSLVNKLQL